MANINVEKLKEKLYPVAKALFAISETLVDASKQHISDRDALTKICSLMHDADIICSRYRVNRLIEDCMGPIVSNTFDDKQVEWLKKALEEQPLQTFEVNYPSSCDKCSNNPKNGGSGICSCTIPYFENPIMYSTGDSCMANNISGNVLHFSTTDKSMEFCADANRIAEAVENTKKYKKKV